jgi:glutamate-1-semialdehyde 2,1-aminomutase
MSITPKLDAAEVADLAQRAAGALPSGIAHDVRFRRPAGPYFVSGSGAHKRDVEGREYVDFVQGHGSLLLGIADPGLTAAISTAAASGTHLGGNHPGEVRWAELVREVVPSVERVRFTASGTEATLMALRLARTVTGRETVVKLEGHFHGWHDYVVAGLEAPYGKPSSPGIPAATAASVEVVAPADVPARLARDDVAAVIFEPNGGTWGTVPLPPAQIRAIADAASAAGTVLVFDEVITGFRAAPGGMQELLGIEPDLTTMAKVLAGGMPGGAIGGRAELLEPLELRADDPEWNRHRHVHHPGTFNANPVSAAAGIAALERIKGGGPTAEANEKGALLRRLLAEALADAPLPTAVWGELSWFHVAPGLAEPPTDIMEFKGLDGALRNGLDRGLLARGVDAMTLGGFVGTAHSEADLRLAAEAYAEAIADVAREIGEI